MATEHARALNFRLRGGEPDDAPALSALARAAKAGWGYPPHWLQAWQPVLTLRAQDFERWWFRLALTDEEQIAGFYALDLRLGMLEHCWVLPAFQGQGLGRQMMTEALGCCRNVGLERLTLIADPHAEAFYRRCGAQRIALKAAPLPDAPERALPLMQIIL